MQTESWKDGQGSSDALLKVGWQGTLSIAKARNTGTFLRAVG